MGKWFCGPLIAGLFFAGAWLSPNMAVAGDRVERFDLQLYSGYRTDEIDWNIASDLSGSSTPNILSELTWEDLEIYQLGLWGDVRISNQLVPFLGLITGFVNYGSIFSGSNRDSDYAGDNRTLEFLRSNNDAGDGEVWDLSIAAGPEFLFFDRKFAVSPLIGYSYHEQNLVIENGFQTIPPDGPLAGLDSSYDAVWKGGWLGINLSFAPVESFNLSGRLEWHTAEYRAEADWNLRDELQHPVSYAHFVDDAEGLVAGLGVELAVNAKVGLTLEATYMNWQAEDGTDTVYLTSGTTETVRLNEVNWESIGLTVGVKTVF